MTNPDPWASLWGREVLDMWRKRPWFRKAVAIDAIRRQPFFGSYTPLGDRVRIVRVPTLGRSQE